MLGEHFWDFQPLRSQSKNIEQSYFSVNESFSTNLTGAEKEKIEIAN
ncbi:MAG: hypothetical protein HC789_05270 [Microcoleus sp. CSU_2_2]|nr:hypothetical protein [Microcoleus sp. CSU_2_2]